MSKVTTEAAGLLGQVIGVSQLNRADMPDERPTGEPMPPWLAALDSLTERDVGVDEWDAVPCAKRLFRRHTDADEQELRTMELCLRRSFVEAFSDGYDNSCAQWILDTRPEVARALSRRKMTHDHGLGDCCAASVRRTHRDVHRAICGEDYAARYERIKRDGGRITETTATEPQTGPTIGGCPWCKEATR